jgi:hypothetical protein
VGFLERSVVRLLGQWHRIAYTEDGRKFTAPPGDLKVLGGAVEILPGGRPMRWSPKSVPALFQRG